VQYIRGRRGTSIPSTCYARIRSQHEREEKFNMTVSFFLFPRYIHVGTTPVTPIVAPAGTNDESHQAALTANEPKPEGRRKRDKTNEECFNCGLKCHHASYVYLLAWVHWLLVQLGGSRWRGTNMYVPWKQKERDHWKFDTEIL
jgi:hypothetical protein